MQAGDVVVMDVGAGWSGYAADVTRTVPVNGRFTPEQRAVYQIVRDAQAAAERVAGPGASYQAWRDSARAVVARGVARLGLTEGVDAKFDPPWADQCRVEAVRCTQAFLYMAHGLGHGIGLEVHEPPWVSKTKGDVVLRPGMVFSVDLSFALGANPAYATTLILGCVAPLWPRHVLAMLLVPLHLAYLAIVFWIGPSASFVLLMAIGGSVAAAFGWFVAVLQYRTARSAFDAAAIIVCHNHPSGDPTPTVDDIEVTRRLAATGQVVGIEVLDHIVVGDGRYVSFREIGLF